MVSLRDILPFSTKVCVMKRVRSDGSVELYCERPTKANVSRDECIECLPVEDCQEIYGLDPTPVFATTKREFYTLDGQLYSRPAQEPARSSHSSSDSSSSHHRNDPSRHPRSTASALRSGGQSINNSVRMSNTGNTRHTERHSSRLSNHDFILNGNGNTINFHNNRTHLNYSGNATSSYREDRHYNTQPASQDRRPSPEVEQRTRNYSPPRERSDFSAAEQAAWEERLWRKLQEEEYARDRSPSPCYDYKDDRDDREKREERTCPRHREDSRGRTRSTYYDYDDSRDERDARLRSTLRERSRCEYSRTRSPSPYFDYQYDRNDRDEREGRPRSRRRQRSDSIEVLDSRFIYAGSGEFQEGDWIYASQREYSADGGFTYIGEGRYDSDGREYSL
ncbi:hypothetical protein CGLO_07098 [Colletotrichum gloeosporioides Cg-14]|uniref:Uncharacterized protein n=1 Tax=Colletotrichum gloeosporioides (strain Cg-14) TaxID=1237896 RepID=T0LNB5_COLGC|nr:hypothetical protein CGLO_07098 [Colletotrichum gloeosporioides Cg-14]